MGKLVTGRVWESLTAAARANKSVSYVSVAYFGTVGAELLPISSGSFLAVNASEKAVKAGQTCPAALIKLQKKGVKIFNVSNLHAKLFVFGKVAFIGSANVSESSASRLVEAVFQTTDPRQVKDIIKFIEQDCCLSEMQPDQLSRLDKIYRPPRDDGGGKRNSNASTAIGSVRIAKLKVTEYPKRSQTLYDRGTAKAEKQFVNRKGFCIEDFHWFGKHGFHVDDDIVSIVDQRNGRFLVEHPAKIIHIENSKHPPREAYVYIQSRERSSVPLGS